MESEVGRAGRARRDFIPETIGPPLGGMGNRRESGRERKGCSQASWGLKGSIRIVQTRAGGPGGGVACMGMNRPSVSAKIDLFYA